MAELRTVVTGDCVFGYEVQVELLRHLVHSPDLLAEALAMPVPMEVSDFDIAACKTIFEALKRYWVAYKAMPTITVLGIECLRVADNADGKSESDPLLPVEYEDLGRVMCRVAEGGGLSTDYYRDQMYEFVRNTRAMRIHREASEAIQYGRGTGVMIAKAAELNAMVSMKSVPPTIALNDTSILEDTADSGVKITTGIRRLDRKLLGGLGLQEVGIVVAGTGVGKTNTLLHMTIKAAAAGWHALYIPLEMSTRKLQERMFAMAAHISCDIMQGRREFWTPDIRARAEMVIRSEFSTNIVIDDSAQKSNRPTVAVIENLVKRWLRNRKELGVEDRAKLVVLDYITELKPSGNYAGNDGDLNWKALLGTMSDYSRCIRGYGLATWTAAQATGVEGVRVMNKGHIAMAKGMLNTVEIAIGVTSMDYERMLKQSMESEADGRSADAEIAGGRQLTFSTMKCRNAQGDAFNLYQGPTLSLWDKKADSDRMDGLIRAGDYRSLFMYQNGGLTPGM